MLSNKFSAVKKYNICVKEKVKKHKYEVAETRDTWVKYLQYFSKSTFHH